MDDQRKQRDTMEAKDEKKESSPDENRQAITNN